MTLRIGLACLTLLLTLGTGTALMPPEKAAFALGGVNYFHRYANGDMHEYTPSGQEDLKRWKDMVTINTYRDAKDGDALVAAANTVLGNYKAAKAVVVKTSSIPRTAEKPAEHLIVVLFPRPDFIEAVFARFRMHEGTGTSVIYSHRIYGAKAGNAMSVWLKKNGPAREKSLMSWNAMPKEGSGK